MNLKIHRGTQEIGGSCVEIWTDKTRIVVDIGMPLVEKDQSEFDITKYKSKSRQELIQLGILPDIEGLYKMDSKKVDGVIISHPHQDHYGLMSYIHPETKYYLGAATHKVLELSNIFTKQKNFLRNYLYFDKNKIFEIGDFKITPFWADHSAFDSYSFLIEANGKKIFYTGDFRAHGRKSKAFYWLKHNAPKDVDYMLMEGTQLGRKGTFNKTEDDIEKELTELFKKGDSVNLVYTSGQNIDRLVSIYRACLRTGKVFVVDVYIATVLKELSQFAALPFPSIDFKNIRVLFPYYLSKRLSNTGKKEILYQFKNFKITKEEIANQADKIVMTVRPSMKKDLDHIARIDGGNLIYSMWEGYLQKEETKEFMDYLLKRGFMLHKIHTSGHADLKSLKEMVRIIDPKYLIPIHTFEGKEYENNFNVDTKPLKDKEKFAI